MYIFPYKSIRKQIWPCPKKGQGQPKVIIWTNFVGPKFPTRAQPRGRFGRKSLPELADFSLFWAGREAEMYRTYWETQNLDQNVSLKSWKCRKTSPCLKAYQDPMSLALWFWRRRILKGFYHIWAWRPSWSHDLDHVNKLLFSHPTEAPYAIWLWLAQRFLRRRCSKSVDDRQRTTQVN